jgi:hypothetical protein
VEPCSSGYNFSGFAEPEYSQQPIARRGAARTDYEAIKEPDPQPHFPPAFVASHAAKEAGEKWRSGSAVGTRQSRSQAEDTEGLIPSSRMAA